MKNLTLICLLAASIALQAQVSIDFSENNSEFTIKNQKISRTIKIDKTNDAIYTTHYIVLSCNRDMAQPGSDEFRFTIDDKLISGGLSGKMMTYIKYEISDNPNGSKTLKIYLKGKTASNAESISITVCYESYPDIAVIRKWIEITSHRKNEVKLSDIEWERINMNVGIYSSPNVNIFTNYGKDWHYSTYIGREHDPAVMVWYNNIAWNNVGFILGNEAPCVLKRTEVYTQYATVSIGVSEDSYDFPFRKWLKPEEKFESYKGFICHFTADKWEDGYEGDFQQFIRKYMGIKLFERQRPPMFVYSPYIPFIDKFSDTLYNQLIDQAADCGIDYFQVTWAWCEFVEGKGCTSVHGDYKVDKNKFPQGLKPVMDHIKARGMKPCLYFQLGLVGRDGKFAKEHPEWLMLNEKGEPYIIHTPWEVNSAQMCLSSGWKESIKKTMIEYIKTYDIKWLMLDLSSVVSAYVPDVALTGCHAKNHQHKDLAESYYLNYKNITDLFDDLKTMFPDLYIDCTFELWGRMHVIDYALIEHADGDWISNIEAQLEMRQICFDKGRVIPTNTMLIGNLVMDMSNPHFSFASLVNGTVVMLGDLRKLTAEEKKWFKEKITSLTKLEDKYHYSRYYQLSDIFQRPTVGGWDGCMRYNPELNGGLLCVYRNNSVETSRTFTLPWVNKDITYHLYSLMTNKDMGIYKGSDLIEKGLKIELIEKNSGEIISIVGK
jgi:alpha-galactosidase